MPSALPVTPAPVVIAIGPHKASWTAVAVDDRLQPLAAIRVEVNRGGYRQLRRFASRWPHTAWAVEGATGLGAALTARLSADSIDVADVPAKLARRVRLLSTGHGRKTGEADALPAGIAAHTATQLTTAVIDEAIAALRALTEHRDDLAPHPHADHQPAARTAGPAHSRRLAPRTDRRHGSRRATPRPPPGCTGRHPAPGRRGTAQRGPPPRSAHRRGNSNTEPFPTSVRCGRGGC